ncbi:hypothetical protein FRB99_000146 [Tulasnella sp. 403]|nr:hypothetical protein FRB99_000146 [Tulasnella sp. 403]
MSLHDLVKRAADRALLVLLSELDDQGTNLAVSSTAQTLDKLDARIKATNAALRLLCNQCAIELAKTCRQRNAAIPVMRLPVEIFMIIFTYAALRPPDVAYPFPDDGLTKLARLTQVCSQWNSIINDHPSLWTTIGARNHPRLTSKALTKSGHLPLRVLLGAGSTDHVVTAPEWRESFALEVGRHLDRWQSVEVRSNSRNTLVPLESVQAPSLTTLRISYTPWFPETLFLPQDLFRGGAPQLVDVSITRLVMRWDSPVLFTNLRRLSLTAYPVGLTFQHLVRILRQSPTLTHLHLVDLCFPPGSFENPPVSIDLPELICLEISEIKYRFATHVLNSLRHAHCRHIVLDLQRLPFDVLWTSISTSLHSALRQASQINIDLAVDATSIEVIDDSRTIVGSFSLTMWQEGTTFIQHATNKFVDVFSTTPVHLSISAFHPYITDDSSSILSFLPTIRSIHLSGDTDPFVRRLSRPVTLPYGPAWLAPNLAVLNLSCGRNMDSLALLVVLVKNRNTENATTTSRDFCSPINRVHIRGDRSIAQMTNLAEFRQLEQILGRRNVTYDDWSRD